MSSTLLFRFEVLFFVSLFVSETICFSISRKTSTILRSSSTLATSTPPHSPRHIKRHLSLNLFLDSNNYVEINRELSQKQHILEIDLHRDHQKILSNTFPSTSLAKVSFFSNTKDHYPPGQHILPTGGGTGVMKLPDVPVTSIVKSSTEESRLQVIDEKTMQPILPRKPSNDERTARFVTKELSFMSKIPLAALVYGSIEFFFMNLKRSNDMYYGYDEEEEEDDVKMMAEFLSSVGLRLGAATIIVFLTFALSS